MKNEHDFLTKFAIASYLAAYKVLLILKENEARKKGKIDLANRYKRALRKVEEFEKEGNFAKK
jgi:hypothetical protein